MTELLSSDSPRALDRAVTALGAGEVIVIPTDTVYGVAVDPFIPGATDRLFAAKQRPREVTLPVLVAEPSDVEAIAVVTDVARDVMARFWPGAVTIVMGRRGDVAADLGTNEKTVGVRCPDHPFARALMRRTGPLAVTSANLHGQATPLTAGPIAALLGDAVAVVVDGGTCEGAPSTVVDCTGAEPRVLRQGATAVLGP